MRYRVVETVQFSDLWQYAVDAGIVDAVEETRLHGLANLLALDPYRFTLFENTGEPLGLRWVDFITGSSVRVQIWYSVVEDDLTVYLESLEVIRPPQAPLPGFDF